MVWERFNRVFHIFSPQNTGKKPNQQHAKASLAPLWKTLFPHQFIVKSLKSLLTGKISWKPTISPRSIVRLIWQILSLSVGIFSDPMYFAR